MSLKKLLSRLRGIGVTVGEKTQTACSGMEEIMLSCPGPSPPFRKGHTFWYPLTLRHGQVEVDQEEVDSLQRYLWKLSDDL